MQITSIDWGPIKENNAVTGTYVTVAADSPLEERIFRLDAPPRLVLDLLGGQLGDQQREISLSDPLVERIRVGQFQPDVLRVVLDLRALRPFCVEYLSPRQIKFTLEHGNLPEQPLPTAKVAIDPGHGGSSSGAVSPDGVPEKEVNLAIGLAAETMLINQGIEVVMTRRQDSTVSLSTRAQTVNNNNCDLVVSVHCNSFFHPSAHGTETYHYPGSDSGRKLATFVQERLIAELGRRNRGVKEANFYMLRETAPPAALVEVAFLSNPFEAELLTRDDFRHRAARAVADGIMAFLQ